MNNVTLCVLSYTGGLILLILIAKIFTKPAKIILKLCINSVFGCFVLSIINSFSHFHGICLGINPVTAAVCGVLGLPGVVLLILLQIILR